MCIRDRILTVPIFVPIAKQFGIDLVHLGVIMCINSMIGTITPPVGMCLYPVMTLGNITMAELVKEIIPFIIVLMIVLIIITYFSPIAVSYTHLLRKQMFNPEKLHLCLVVGQ